MEGWKEIWCWQKEVVYSPASWRVLSPFQSFILNKPIRIFITSCVLGCWQSNGIPSCVFRIGHWDVCIPSGRTMALGTTQPITQMSTRDISWPVKAAGAQGWQPCYLHVPIVLKSGNLNLLEPSGPVQACNGIALPFFFNLQTPHFKYLLNKYTYWIF